MRTQFIVSVFHFPETKIVKYYKWHHEVMEEIERRPIQMAAVQKHTFLHSWTQAFRRFSTRFCQRIHQAMCETCGETWHVIHVGVIHMSKWNLRTLIVLFCKCLGTIRDWICREIVNQWDIKLDDDYVGSYLFSYLLFGRL